MDRSYVQVQHKVCKQFAKMREEVVFFTRWQSSSILTWQCFHTNPQQVGPFPSGTSSESEYSAHGKASQTATKMQTKGAVSHD